MSSLFSPVRALFRATLPLQLEPRDDAVGLADYLSDDQLRTAFVGKRALVVGGTKGIGRSIADVLLDAGAKVLVVGRSATGAAGVGADISTVAGCHALVDALSANDSAPFDHVIFTAGLWPDPSAPYTSEGVDKVVAVDLVARHVVLTQLAARSMLAPDARVLSVLAAASRFPGVGDPEALKKRLSQSVIDTSAGAPPPARGGMRDIPLTLFSTALAHDVWLAHIGRSGLLPSQCRLLATFPGLLVSELPRSTLPSWLVPLAQLAMTPLADTPQTMGRNHCSLLAAPCAANRIVTYWAAPLLDARMPSPLAEDLSLGAWIVDFLDGIAARGAPAPEESGGGADALDRGTDP